MRIALATVCTIAGLIFASPTWAADLPVKAPPPAAPIDIWTGPYVGLNVGGTWADDPFHSVGVPGACNAAVAGCTATPNYSTLSALAATFSSTVYRPGVIYGGQIGYNWKVNNAVFGVEADFQGISDSHSNTFSSVTPSPAFPAFPLSQTATLSESMREFGTLRGRAGLLWGPNVLFYGTGGFAYANVSATTTIGQNLVSPGVGPYGTIGQTSSWRYGWVVGAGTEWKWTANWSIKGEYLYADLGNMSYNTGPLISPLAGFVFSAANTTTTVHVHENIFRAGINYSFGAGPILAKY
jgi:outer membrane immunogenic protein